MEWIDLLEQHQKEWEEFSELKQRAWQRIVKNNEAILTSFGDDINNVPDGTKKVMEQRGEEWVRRWGMNGKEMTDLLFKQNAERRAYIKEYRRLFVDGIRKNIDRQRQDRKSRNKSNENSYEIE